MITNQPPKPSGIDGSTDQRVILAREYLAGVSQQHVDQLPPSVLVRECAELRRQFGQVLTAVADQPTALTEAQRGTILGMAVFVVVGAALAVKLAGPVLAPSPSWSA
jgi:hypothetical protein